MLGGVNRKIPLGGLYGDANALTTKFFNAVMADCTRSSPTGCHCHYLCSFCDLVQTLSSQTQSRVNPKDNYSKFIFKAPANKRRIPNARHNNHRVANVWNNGYNYSHGYSLKEFNWIDHLYLIREEVEHGWSTFSFTYMSSASFPVTPNKFWESCSNSSGKGMEHVYSLNKTTSYIFSL